METTVPQKTYGCLVFMIFNGLRAILASYCEFSNTLDPGLSNLMLQIVFYLEDPG